MPQENENVFIAESQSLDVDEQKKNDTLNVIESCNDLQDFIKRLEEENLIWYFIDPLRKDEDITGQINLKWEKEFQKFEQSIDAMHKELKSSLPGQNFLVYPTKDNDFKIRFENEEKPIEISNILRTSSEGKVYNISLGKDSQITATKKGSERHYDFTGSSSCEMTINWQAKDSEGNSIDCSMTVKLDSGGIQSVIGEPKFGGITSSEEVLKLVGQNKEVFINGKTLYQAFTGISKSVDDQQVPAEEIFTKDLHISPQSPTPSSSGYSSPSTPSSRRSSISTSSEFSDEDEIFEDDMSGDEEEYEQEGLKDEVEELEEEKETFAKYFAVQAKQLEDLRLERDSLRDKVNEQQRAIFERGQRIKEQEEELQDKNDVIKNLNDQLKDKKGETNEANKELQRKLKQSEANLTVLKEKNANLENDLKKIVEGLKDDHKKQLAEQLMETKKENNTLAETASQLSKELNELQREKEDLEREIRQLEPGRSLADELSEENTKREIEKLQYQLKEKEGMLTCTQEELASVKESLEQLQNILQQEKGQATQTEVEYESRGTSMQQQDQGIQAVNNNSSRTASGLRQENKKLTRDKLTISEQLKQKIREIDELKKNLKQLQEENKQLKQEVTKNAGVDASSSTGQKEAKEAKVIPQNIMDWPVPIPDDKPEEQKTPLEPIKVNTELSDPKSIPAEGPEKSPPLSK
ncbi:coiled-coil domain-containing protein [Wolbachia endosymbiont of Zaprionus taronus]|uniref:hypothetical protein n=1 Tax=Wolbachia endosymbiont of Zaprionus taronus TaxID=2603208 RepID=UPI00294A77BC|nr:hypothetical protein [Wolbachia endosymbiont of Zaprionus taronus]MDV6248761.1 hypothetical protein [Wolbachia endosymbiont of Zaprionus taronus]